MELHVASIQEWEIIFATVLSVAQVGKNDGVVNPNLAGKDDLLRLEHLDETLVASILERRPSIGMLDLHGLLKPVFEQGGARAALQAAKIGKYVDDDEVARLDLKQAH